MCNLESEGVKYGCGHYVKVRDVNKIDCMRSNCTLSVTHPRTCRSSSCAIYYGPDRSETIIRTTEEYCSHCEFWFKSGRVRQQHG
ncbi:hypothetical protein VKT23_000692 [Stygiomarasmius scandens]|uniref:Uncharacterized protein n=1 Tax=Marasmiellus scandens TaxID=2682957 RepID=A0ABR1K7F7_9AGAR